MNRLPECLVVVDPGKEKNAVHEARLLGIKVVSLIDTDSDPDLVDLVIPGNDDSLRSIRLVVQQLTDAIKQGKSMRPEEPKKVDPGDEPKAVPTIA
jgi:small subunit ribosomal protein S2